MPIERSSQIQEQINTIRQEIKDLPEDKSQEKREKAKQLRTEIMLGTGSLMDTAFRTIENKPDITTEEMEATLNGTGKVLNPELTHKFVENLAYTCAEVRKFMDAVAYRGGDPATTVYRGIQKFPGAKPKDSAELVFHPLALGLRVSREDFRRIDTRENVGGFYDREKKIRLLFVKVPLPLIVEGNDRSERALIHELGHAENNQVGKSLTRPKKTILVLPDGTESISEFEHNEKYFAWGLQNVRSDTIPYLSSATEEELTTPEAQVQIERLLSYTMACAKDELLAEMHATTRGGNPPRYLVSNLLNPEGIYDYFGKFGIDKDSPVYKLLWERYTHDLMVNAQAALYLHHFYSTATMHGETVMAPRVSSFRYILATHPIEKWNEIIEDSSLPEEVLALKGVEGLFYEVAEMEAIIRSVEGMNFDERLHQQLEQVHELRAEFTRLLAQDSGKLLLVQIAELERQLWELGEQITETPYRESLTIAILNKRLREIAALGPSKAVFSNGVDIQDGILALDVDNNQLIEYISSYNECLHSTQSSVEVTFASEEFRDRWYKHGHYMNLPLYRLLTAPSKFTLSPAAFRYIYATEVLRDESLETESDQLSPEVETSKMRNIRGKIAVKDARDGSLLSSMSIELTGEVQDTDENNQPIWRTFNLEVPREKTMSFFRRKMKKHDE